MSKYLELFKSTFDDSIGTKTKPENKPYIGYSLTDGKLAYTVIPKPYVTFTAEEDNSSIGLAKLSTNQTLEYSTDTTSWNSFDTTTNISLNNGNKVYVRGVLSGDNNGTNYTQFKMVGKIAASGNCNAIWNYQDLNAPLKTYCGCRMFRDCTSLTVAPELPATELAGNCYASMFSGCTSLTIVPELPATELARGCYHGMFNGCTSLMIVPKVLPATTLANWCYENMFYNCTSLTVAPELPATMLTEQCYSNMFCGCSSLTTAPELPAIMLTEQCYNSMFCECTSLTIAPELPATKLAKTCYFKMFYNCSSLTTAPEILPATELAEKCYNYMFRGCTSLTTAPELPATELKRDWCYENMFGGCTNLNHITCLATDISAEGCTYDWVWGVSSAGTFVKHPDMNGWTTGRSGIPEGWIVVDAEL